LNPNLESKPLIQTLDVTPASKSNEGFKVWIQGLDSKFEFKVWVQFEANSRVQNQSKYWFSLESGDDSIFLKVTTVERYANCMFARLVKTMVL
jgi:hypothetical protein